MTVSAFQTIDPNPLKWAELKRAHVLTLESVYIQYFFFKFYKAINMLFISFFNFLNFELYIFLFYYRDFLLPEQQDHYLQFQQQTSIMLCSIKYPSRTLLKTLDY